MTHLEKTLAFGGAVLMALSLPVSALAQVHGFVEPCTVSFVEDNQTVCELCEPASGGLEQCKEQLASRGYKFKCRTTPGHSKPAEVWCAPKDQQSNATKQWIATGVATAVLGVVFFLTRRRRPKKKKRIEKK